MRILAVSDEESPFIWDFFDRSAFGGVEMILSCGDLKRDYLEFLCTLLPVPLYYVPGNHDAGFELRPPGGCLPLDGRCVVEGGLRLCGLGGCRNDAAPGRPFQFSDEEMSRRARKLRRCIGKVGGLDILVTHAPPEGFGDGDDKFHRGFSAFRTLLDEYRPKLHLYGHQHPRYGRAPGALFYGGTRVVNACGYKIIDV